MSAIWSTGSKTRAPLSNAPRCGARTTPATPIGASPAEVAAVGGASEGAWADPTRSALPAAAPPAMTAPMSTRVSTMMTPTISTMMMFRPWRRSGRTDPPPEYSTVIRSRPNRKPITSLRRPTGTRIETQLSLMTPRKSAKMNQSWWTNSIRRSSPLQSDRVGMLPERSASIMSANLGCVLSVPSGADGRAEASATTTTNPQWPTRRRRTRRKTTPRTCRSAKTRKPTLPFRPTTKDRPVVAIRQPPALHPVRRITTAVSRWAWLTHNLIRTA